ncbi:hypothetical protein CCMSSC00406_0004267 [Pleurotus cornucopiae]|uniref:Uncharacterized protein n=1 Tax=Pleurotus cornucopiae TaxID=5321 RepID=A0ACB7JAU1_PLECO|nr:hypothetical protein CCMSSC00406_0004267 [Pleurotus cornucopiae]
MSLALLTVASVSVLSALAKSPVQRDPLSSTSPEAWEHLRREVDGRLYAGVPFAQQCFDDSTSEACLVARRAYLDETSRSNTFGAYINTQWETCQTTAEQCLLDFTDPNSALPTSPPNKCSQGSISNYYIDVRLPQDISAAFAFSRKTAVPLVVKNTGHDYKGRSSAPRSLALWTHNLRNAGVMWGEAYAFAEAHNITVVGGSDKNVGVAGGWLQGGGHGALSNSMGLGVDRVLEFKIVTPDGKFRTVNACQNEDLFFALRGGGGGTFGVVTEATILASPQVTLQAVVVSFPRPTPGSNITQELFSIIVANSIRWADEGWGGLANGFTAIYVNPLISQAKAAESMKPLIDFANRVKSENNMTSARIVATEFPSWGQFFNFFANGFVAAVGQSLALTSRLVNQDNFATAHKQQQLINALTAANAETQSLIILISPPHRFSRRGEAKKIKANNAITSVTPMWRESIYHITTVSPWNWNATTFEKKAQYQRASTAMDHLRRITPDASYVNEADVHESNHESAFWGHNFKELLRIKKKYDPEHLLDCWHCVGWNQQSPRFSCYI